MDKNPSKNELVVKLSRCDTQSERVLRSQKSHENKENKNACAENSKSADSFTMPKVPAKRNRRLKSTPIHDENPRDDLNAPPVVPAKRNRRLQSTPQLSPNFSASSNTGNDPVSSLVAVNCKLTNEFLVMKKQLYDKNEELLKIQCILNEKNIEMIKLESKIAERDAEIEELRNNLEKFKAEKFCNDLIEFDDSVGKPNGK